MSRDMWARGRLKWDTQMAPGGTPSTDDAASWVEPETQGSLPFVAISDMSRRKRVSATVKALDSDVVAAHRLPIGAPGTLLFAMYASVGEVAFLDLSATWNQAILGITVGPNLDARFLYYTLLGARDDLLREVRSTTQSNLNARQVGDIWYRRPEVPEQQAIADYLDRETARIDAVIAKQQSLVALLRERRACAMDVALNARGFASPLRLEDFGNLPEGWFTAPLGSVLEELTNGFVGPTRDILVDEGIRYIQGTHIKNGRIDFERRPFFVEREWHERRPRVHLRSGDVLIVQTGQIGNVAVVPANFGEASCHALQIARVRSRLMSGQYLGAYLSSRVGRQSLLSRATGAMHPHLEAGIRSVPVVIPPLAEQGRIVAEVDDQTLKIDGLVRTTERFVELAKERRSALITAAVNGQIDVQEGAA